MSGHLWARWARWAHRARLEQGANGHTTYALGPGVMSIKYLKVSLGKLVYPDVPRRAQTCSDVPRPDELYHRGANGAVTTPLQGCEWEVLKESVVFRWT